MSIDQQWVGNISADNRGVIHTHIIDVIHDVDTFTLRRISRLHNPNVLFAVVLLKLLVVSIKVTKFIREDVSVRHEVEVLLAVAFLHPHYVVTQPVLPRYLVTIWEMIDLLVFIESFIDVAFATTTTPEHIPLMRFGMCEPIGF